MKKNYTCLINLALVLLNISLSCKNEDDFYKNQNEITEDHLTHMFINDNPPLIVDWTPKKCSNGDLCHDAQPRGYQAKKTSAALKTGTQGMRSAVERSKIPHKLGLEIAQICEQNRVTSEQRRLI